MRANDDDRIELNGDSYETLTTFIVRRAKEDVVALKENGIIKEGKVIKQWPRARHKDGRLRFLSVRGMRRMAEAQDVIAFFRDGRCDTVLDALRYKLTEAAIRRELEI